jgi:starch phosphorylase
VNIEDKSWFKHFTASPACDYIRRHPIVYFCAEFAISDAIPIYAGGLGILAGDIIREAAEQEVPLITVGLYYHEGYLHHDLYSNGILMKGAQRTDPTTIGLSPVVDADNKRVIITVPVQSASVYVQAWTLQIEGVKSYLLDTNLEQNTEEDRHITDYLYASSKETRFKQEIVLGLGGLRFLEALHITPIAYHLNEGHSALLALEIARYEMKKNSSMFATELAAIKQHIIFTNHTLIPGGNDVYSVDLVSSLLSGFAKELQVPVTDIINLGVIAKSDIFSMTHLALRLSGKITAVSKLHAEKAKEIWEEYPMTPITNGIHIKTWDKSESGDLWENHQKNKRLLLTNIRNVTGTQWDENTLLLGWGRRIVEYKRPLALFKNLLRFKNLATSQERPLRVVISGLSHASDAEGLTILEKIQEIVTSDLKDIVIYLPDYRMENSKLLTSGCDVWLNTPIVGFEACGTSGMKAALNGVLPCSTGDGWVAEAELYKVGWLLQDTHVSEDVISVLEQKIIPLYYNKDANQIPGKWVEMMYNAREMAINQFGATKMLRKYFEELYLPIISTHESGLS